MKVKEEIEFLNQPITGILVFRPGQETSQSLTKLIADRKWKVLRNSKTRLIVQASRRDLLTVKQSWLEDSNKDEKKQFLGCILSNIILAGR